MITKEEEFAVIDRILAGDQRSYAQLVDAYKSYAYTIAYKILENRPEAEEAAQDSFIKAYHHLKSFNREARFSTWLYRIVFNTAISQKRKSKNNLTTIENKIIEYNTRSDDDLLEADKQQFIAQAIKKLNEADRVSIQLYYIKEFSLEEVANMMGQNANTIKVRIHRARQRLAEELTKLLKHEAVTL